MHNLEKTSIYQHGIREVDTSKKYTAVVRDNLGRKMGTADLIEKGKKLKNST